MRLIRCLHARSCLCALMHARTRNKQGLGCEMSEARCRSLIAVYDLDRSGVLEAEEFVTWMMLEHVRVRTHPSCVCACASVSTRVTR